MADRAAAERACKDPNPNIDGRKANVNLAYLGAKPRSLHPGKLPPRLLLYSAAEYLGVEPTPLSLLGGAGCCHMPTGQPAPGWTPLSTSWTLSPVGRKGKAGASASPSWKEEVNSPRGEAGGGLRCCAGVRLSPPCAFRVYHWPAAAAPHAHPEDVRVSGGPGPGCPVRALKGGLLSPQPPCPLPP